MFLNSWIGLFLLQQLWEEFLLDSDFMGAIESGTGILLDGTIIYEYVEEMKKSQNEKKWLGWNNKFTYVIMRIK